MMLHSLLATIFCLVGMTNERILFLSDARVPSLERELVSNTLVACMLNDPNIELLTAQPLPPAQRLAARMARDAQAASHKARQCLEALEPALAQRHASYALLRLERLADLTGDVTALIDVLALHSAALLHLGAKTQAAVSIERLLALDSSWQPDGALFCPDMKATVSALRQHFANQPTKTLQLCASEQDAALFVDGHFVAFGAATLELTPGVAHHVWAHGKDGANLGRRISLAHSQAGPLEPIHLHLPQATRPALMGHYERLIEANQSPSGFVNPDNPLLRARNISKLYVLDYQHGTLNLTSFDMALGRRRLAQAPAIVTNIWDASRLADDLLGQVRTSKPGFISPKQP